MHAPGSHRFRTFARRVTLGGFGTYVAAVAIGLIWKETTGAWPVESFPQGPFPFFAVAGILALCGGMVMRAIDGAVRAVRWVRERRNRPDRTGG